MKLKLIAACSIVLAVGANAASITVGNITFGGTDLLLFDNSGTPITDGTLSLFIGSSPTDIDTALTLSDPIAQFELSAEAGTAPGGGLFSGAFEFPNPDGGAVRDADIFVLIANEDGSQLAAYDLATVVNAPDVPTPFAGDENFTQANLVTLGEVAEITGDFSAIGAGDAPANSLTLAAVPEPSAALLAGFALIGGLIRRRR